MTQSGRSLASIGILAMNQRCKDTQITLGVTVACFLVSALLVLPKPGHAEPKLIPIGECELNGFPLGGTVEEMHKALGEPESTSAKMTSGDEYAHLESKYDGLRIVFSMRGRSALSFFVSSEKYQLRSGVGVGSTRQEIESALGPTGYFKSGGIVFMAYRVTGSDGRPIPVQLTIKLERDIAVEYTLISR